MVFFDPNDLDDLAWNCHYFGAGNITLEDLEKRGWATEDHLLELMSQVNAYLSMWEDTYKDMERIQQELEKKRVNQ